VAIPIRIISKYGYRYVQLAALKKGDKFQFDFPNDHYDENVSGDETFVASSDAVTDSSGEVSVEINKPRNPRFDSSYKRKLDVEGYEIQVKPRQGYGFYSNFDFRKI
jgi:hypothetical protein